MLASRATRTLALTQSLVAFLRFGPIAFRLHPNTTPRYPLYHPIRPSLQKLQSRLIDQNKTYHFSCSFFPLVGPRKSGTASLC